MHTVIKTFQAVPRQMIHSPEETVRNTINQFNQKNVLVFGFSLTALALAHIYHPGTSEAKAKKNRLYSSKYATGKQTAAFSVFISLQCLSYFFF